MNYNGCLKSIIICIGLFQFSSCTDFLKEDPKSTLPAETFFQSKTFVEAAVNNLYRGGPNNWANPSVFSGSHLMMGGWSSGMFDNLNFKGGGGEYHVSALQNLNVTSYNIDSKLWIIWNEPFIYISRANTLITVLPGVDLPGTGMTEDDRKRYIAEAKFFRAYNYLYLVRHFGDVPLLTQPQNAADDLQVPRVDAKRIYDEIIIPDLQEAVRSLPVKAQYNNSMRITAAVASAVLIDACMQMAGFPLQDASKWQMATTEAKKFLPGGVYASLHSLCVNEDYEELSAYNQLRSVGVREASPGGRRTTSCSEFIYANEFLSGTANANFSANAWPWSVSSLNQSESLVRLTNNAYKPMPRYLAMYDEANDLRMKQNQFFADSFQLKNGSWLPHPLNDTPSPYFYHDYGAVRVENASGRHFALYRLAEMYLNAAECIAQTEGVTAQAVDALAAIRARAYEYGGIAKNEIVAQLSALSKEEFIEEVWLERYRELVFEFKDWNLIQRTRKYPKTNPMDNSIPVGTAQFVDVTTVGTDFSIGKLFSVNNLLWPVPISQMQLNPNLVQNPGYEL